MHRAIFVDIHGDEEVHEIAQAYPVAKLAVQLEDTNRGLFSQMTACLSPLNVAYIKYAYYAYDPSRDAYIYKEID